MSLVPNSREISASIEYSPVGNDHNHEDTGRPFPSDSSNHSTETNLARTLSSHFEYERSLTTTCVNEYEMSPSGQKTSGYKGPPVVGWPTTPQKLSNFSVPLFLGDVVLVLLPIAFIVLGIFAWTLNGKELSEAGSIVEGAMNLGPTIYPLAFAAIGSRCLRNIAVHLAERGTTIATLEKLLGSQSLVSAIGTAFTLRSYSLLSLTVLLLWVLSPLGGQSSLRLLHQANSTVSEPGTVYYSDHDATFDPSPEGSWLGTVPAVLTANLASSKEAKDLPVDLWAHPKVPRLDTVEQFARDFSMSQSDWIAVNTTAPQRYSSWTGINVQGLDKTRSAEFEAKYNYLYVDCEVLFRGEPKKVWQDLLAANLTIYPSIPSVPNDTIIDSYKLIRGGNTRGISMFLKVAQPPNSTNKFTNDTAQSSFEYNHQPISFLYGASYVNGDPDFAKSEVVMVHTCTPHMVTLDARFRCQGGDCVATYLRYLPGPSRSTLALSCDIENKIGCWTLGTKALPQLVYYLPRALDLPLGGRTSPFDDWIVGGDIAFRGQLHPSLDKLRLADNISDKVISERLTTLLNTFYHATAWGPQITRGGLFEVPQYDRKPSVTGMIMPEQWINSTEAVFSVLIPTYKADVGWIVSLLLITTILLLLGILNIVISFLTAAPDLFYYASSLARENPYTDVPDGGTALNGAERSRLLRSMRVQIADASPENEVGYIVLKSVGDDDTFQTGRLKKDKLYW